jgi:hypothetical protein
MALLSELDRNFGQHLAAKAVGSVASALRD